MDITSILVNVVLGILLGMIGQGIRAIVGIKKENDQAAGKDWKEWFDMNELVLSLIIGGIAGGLSATLLLSRGTEVDRDSLLTLVGSGYAGTDFIEGFMVRKTPTS